MSFCEVFTTGENNIWKLDYISALLECFLTDRGLFHVELCAAVQQGGIQDTAVAKIY